MTQTAVLRAVQARPQLRLVQGGLDEVSGYWLDVLRHELSVCRDAHYAHVLDAMMCEIRDGMVVLPRRCRRCLHYFDQPKASPNKWQQYCSKACCAAFNRRRRAR